MEECYFFPKVKDLLTKSNTLPWVFFTYIKLYKWYQIAQHIYLEINCN